MSWGFFADAALTTPLTELLTDDDTTASLLPTVPVWFGNPTAGEQVRAMSNPGTDPITVTPASTVPAWAASTAYGLGVVRTPTASNNRVYQATVAGTSAGSEPTWPTTVGATVTDGGVTWTCLAYEDAPAEYKLATTIGGLAGATAGAGLSLGTAILGGVANAVAFYVRCTDADHVTQDQTQLQLATNALRIDAAP